MRPQAEMAEGRLLAVRVILTGATKLHGRFIADPDRLRDEVEAAAQRCADDIWLERLRIETAQLEAPAGDAALAEIDLAAALQKCEADAALRRVWPNSSRRSRTSSPEGWRRTRARRSTSISS